MKFEFDHRTGTMMPKKDEEIYFAQSQGGGLRIDDHKNNIKYIIERDGRVTNLFGVRGADGLNIYDMRDARIIADRVLRMFGRSHKYSDFHYFLKGYHMKESVVKSYSEYINEDIFDTIFKKDAEKELKKEDGKYIADLDDGTMLIHPDAFFDGKIIKVDDKPYLYFKETDTYFVIFDGKDEETYYRYDPDAEKGRPNLVESFNAVSTLRTEKLDFLKAVAISGDFAPSDFDGLDVDINSYGVLFDGFKKSFEVWNDHDAVEEYAVDMMKDCLDDIDESEAKRYEKFFGKDFYDIDAMKSELKGSYQLYIDDADEEDAIDELLSNNIIKDTEEFFELDENGEPDHTQPKFNYVDYSEEYADNRLENIDDIFEEFITQFGYDDIEEYIDKDKLAKLVVDHDGPEGMIASYDGKERIEEINGTTYYIYRTS